MAEIIIKLRLNARNADLLPKAIAMLAMDAAQFAAGSVDPRNFIINPVYDADGNPVGQVDCRYEMDAAEIEDSRRADEPDVDDWNGFIFGRDDEFDHVCYDHHNEPY